MTTGTQYKIMAFITFSLSSTLAFAQVKTADNTTIELDTFTKVIGILLTIGGFFMGYMQLKMASKIAEVEARFNRAIAEVKDNFTKKIENETEKLETKITLSGKEIESKMATRHDIDNVKTVVKLQHENTKLQLDGLKEQLKTAAATYKRDKE